MGSQRLLDTLDLQIGLPYNIPIWRTIRRPDTFPFICIGMLALYTTAVYAATRNPKKTTLALFSKLGPALTIGISYWLASYYFSSSLRIGSITIATDLLPLPYDAAARIFGSNSVWACKKAKWMAWIARVCRGPDGWKYILDEELAVFIRDATEVYLKFQSLLFGVQHWWYWESKLDWIDMNGEIEEQRINLERFGSGEGSE